MFAYMYYRLFLFYKNIWKESDPDIYTNGVIATLQGLNIFAIIALIESLCKIEIISKLFVFITVIILLIFNNFKYHNKFEKYEKQWSQEDTRTKNKKVIFLFIYGICSIGVFFLLHEIFRH